VSRPEPTRSARHSRGSSDGSPNWIRPAFTAWMSQAMVICETAARTSRQLRPWSLMVVIANADDYIDDMLVALRA